MNEFKRLILCFFAILLLLPFSMPAAFAEPAPESTPAPTAQEDDGRVIPDMKRYRAEDGFPAISAFTVDAGAALLYELNCQPAHFSFNNKVPHIKVSAFLLHYAELYL